MGGPVWYEKDLMTLVNLRVAVTRPYIAKTSKNSEALLTPETELIIIQPPVVRAKINMGDEICDLTVSVVVRVPSSDDCEVAIPLLGLKLLDGEWTQMERWMEREEQAQE